MTESNQRLCPHEHVAPCAVAAGTNKPRGVEWKVWRPTVLLLITVFLFLIGLLFSHLSKPGHESVSLQVNAPQRIGIYSTTPGFAIHVIADITWQGTPKTDLWVTVTGRSVKPSTPIIVISSLPPVADEGMGPTPNFKPALFRYDRPPYMITSAKEYIYQTTVKQISLPGFNSRNGPTYGPYGAYLGTFNLRHVTEDSNGRFFAHLPQLGLDEGPDYSGFPSFMSEKSSTASQKTIDLIENPTLRNPSQSYSPSSAYDAVNYYSYSKGPLQLYWGPNSLTTTEVLENSVPKFDNSTIDSMVVPQNGSADGAKYEWTENTILEPAIALTDRDAADAQEKYLFRSGIAYGVAAATFAAFIVEMPRRYPFNGLIEFFIRFRRKLRNSLARGHRRSRPQPPAEAPVAQRADEANPGVAEAEPPTAAGA